MALAGLVFRPVTNNRTGDLDQPLDPASVYRNIVLKYGLETGISAKLNGLCVHTLRATAATIGLSHEADIAKVQEWLGHAPTSPPRGPTIDARRARRTAGHSGLGIDHCTRVSDECHKPRTKP
jgi:integrase